MMKRKENILSSELENKREFNENKVVYDLYFIITRLSFFLGERVRHVFCVLSSPSPQCLAPFPPRDQPNN